MPPVNVTVPNADGVPAGSVSSWQQDASNPANGVVSNTPIGTTPTSPVMNSNVSRSQTNANTQIYNAKVDSLAATSGTYTDGQSKTNPDGSPRADQPTNTGVVVNAGADPNAAADGFKWAYQTDGTKVQIPQSSNSAQYSMTDNAPLNSSPSTTTPTDPNTAINAKYAKQGADYTANAQKQLDSAKTEMDAWKTSNDAIANSRIDGIKATFDASIATMTEMNRQATARDTATGYGNGAARYAPQLNDSVISDTVQKGIMRINDLKAQEITAIAQAQQAKNNDDIAEFNKYMDQVNKSNSDVTSELTRLSAQANADKNQLLKTAADARAETKAQQVADENNAKSYAPGVNEALSGLPSDAAKKKYLENIAKKLGVDPALLESEAVKYGLTRSKTEAGIANTENQIQNRNITTANNTTRTTIAANKASGKTPAQPKGGKDGAYSYTANDISTYASFLNQGGKLADGTIVNGRGKDGFVDPTSYTTAFDDWMKHNGSPKGFTKQFPVTNVNPASYGELPEAIRPKAKAGTNHFN